MALIRRRLLALSLLTIALTAILSLALVATASNPTGRYFSSEILITGGNDSGYIAETMLSADLGLPQNDSGNGEKRCFCSENHAAPPGRCNVCDVNTPDISNWIIPDFITDDLIIDSKAVSELYITPQLTGFAAVAQATDRELWVFVRLDTFITPAIIDMVEATGGNVVRYFVVEGYTARLILENALHNLLLVALIIAVGLFVWDYMERQSRHVDDEPEPPQAAKRAEDSTEETEEYMRRMERLSKRTLHDEDKPDN